jgi:hypothetical protein
MIVERSTVTKPATERNLRTRNVPSLLRESPPNLKFTKPLWPTVSSNRSPVALAKSRQSSRTRKSRIDFACQGCNATFLTTSGLHQHQWQCPKMKDSRLATQNRKLALAKKEREEQYRWEVDALRLVIAARRSREEALLADRSTFGSVTAAGRPPWIDASSPPVERLPFELLRSGTADVGYFRDYSSRHHRSVAAQRRDEERLSKLNSLKPSRRFCGSKAWDGYLVYEFDWARMAVIESAILNNAVFVVSGDWRQVVERDKTYVRESMGRQSTRITHIGDWFTQIKNVLGYKRHIDGIRAGKKTRGETPDRRR